MAIGGGVHRNAADSGDLERFTGGIGGMDVPLVGRCSWDKYRWKIAEILS
jgi:hypothetical protein